MPGVAPFETHTDRYEAWFDAHEHVYQAELAALDRLVPERGRALEIGVGTGRFAAPLGVDVGVDPAPAMLDRARERGVETVRGVAEALPFREHSFETALLVTTVCFVDDLAATLREADRVLPPSGRLVIGYVDADSPLGRRYRESSDQNPFYEDATFVTTDDLLGELEAAGFHDVEFVQTITGPLNEVDDSEPVKPGYGDGSFVGLAARR
jgi:SAM-dependent methyltransferase